MLIENPELLRTWLTAHLKPLCDADPVALAKYVLALIRKDKPVDELRDTMVQQMDVFLQAETLGFIDILFQVVESKEYELPPKAEEEENGKGELKGEEERNEVQHEADSTTPIREGLKDEVKKDEDDRRKYRGSPPPPARRRVNRTPPRRYRERSFSPRHDRTRVVRRRSRSPLVRRGRPLSRSPPRHRPRSLDRSPPRRGTSRDSTPTRDEGGYNPSSKRIRCRDYDEKGFCLKGDLCKFDHGTDAVVLEDSSKAPLGYQPGQPVTEPYIPGIGVPGIPFPPPAISVPPPGYPVPGMKRAYDGGHEPASKSSRFDYSRVGGRGRGRGGRGGGRGGGGASNMLAVRNIPPEFNSITHLNAHFARFGMLQNIQINFEGDPGSALISFSNNSEANAAFNSSEAVMNNRFIKVFWHMNKSAFKDRTGTAGSSPLVLVTGDRITKTLVNEEMREGEEGNRVKEEREKAVIAIQKNQDMLQTKADLMKKSEEKRKEAMKQQETLIKSKQGLLDGYLEQQKVLISKLEKGKGSMKAEDKKTIMDLIKELSNSIDRTKEEIKTSLTISSVKTKTLKEIQKELLDAEMELFTSQQDGSDSTAEIQQKVNLLRLEAAKCGFLPTSRPARGRGGFRARGFRGMYTPRGAWRGARGRGRGFTLSPGSSTLDRRPSRILVSGYELDDKDDILVHFQKFGEITDIMEDQATPSVILKYKTRRFAETAMSSGKNFNDRVLQLSWYNQGTPDREAEPQYTGEEEVPDDDYTPPQHDYLPPGLQEHEDSLSQGSLAEEEGEGDEELGAEDLGDEEEEQVEEEEEELNEGLLDDDDEDEEEEERSWKRRNADED
ncbi:RNA-binding protein 26 isoform X2 [Eurytemora carolleeae]|uniref:RNA-binding protein 26 isoform X2 n=1 Tax=Eurytemora carolleeae TaxID=1294199 RepID=UPI000C7841BA|nr:RNA-binding protein 26 isoform X2 [Eurytemora carolleeae]|eukprot:XP_023337167.1 RNA-binding protein 26-like isoform X2 [Eurytemora affinis]